jgi:hypothetical protein
VPSSSVSSSLEQLLCVHGVYYKGTGDEGSERTVGGKPNGDPGGTAGMGGLN